MMRHLQLILIAVALMASIVHADRYHYARISKKEFHMIVPNNNNHSLVVRLHARKVRHISDATGQLLFKTTYTLPGGADMSVHFPGQSEKAEIKVSTEGMVSVHMGTLAYTWTEIENSQERYLANLINNNGHRVAQLRLEGNGCGLAVSVPEPMSMLLQSVLAYSGYLQIKWQMLWKLLQMGREETDRSGAEYRGFSQCIYMCAF